MTYGLEKWIVIEAKRSGQRLTGSFPSAVNIWENLGLGLLRSFSLESRSKEKVGRGGTTRTKVMREEGVRKVLELGMCCSMTDRSGKGIQAGGGDRHSRQAHPPG